MTDRAPDFELTGDDGQIYRLSDYRGVPVVLIFYPSDFSPVCSEEHASFVDVMDRLNRTDAQVFGISVDSKWSHTAFAEKEDIEYPLLADFHPRGEVGKAYGVYLPDKGVHRRWTFVIDPEGRVAFIQQNQQGEVPDVEEIVAAVEDVL
jgi:peroxiredoxin (alkyl hydroperoxide reductase subunit C)